MSKRFVIGTPLSPSATKVMLLGSGELGKEVIIALQRLGVETIAVDRYPNAPGHQVAHRAHVINMADGTALRELIEREQPHIIVPEIEAIATSMLLEIEREGLARVIPTARAAQLTMNREGIRCLAAETLGLPTSTYTFANSLEELYSAIEGGIGYPCIVKPVMSSSGKGQSKIDSEAEVEAAWNYAASGSRVDQGRVIVEGFIHFDYEITLLTVRAMNADGDIETHFCEPIGHIQVHGDYVESWQPQPMSLLALQRAQDIARRITGNLGGLGIFGVELFVKNDEVWFSEVSPRPHDTGMVTMCSQVQNEFELHARAILGLPVNTALRAPGASAVIYGQLEEQGIAFTGVDEALCVPQSDLRLFGKPESFARRRMGVALANGTDTSEARTRAKLAASRIVPIKPRN
ncbi:formate-dependent phosphoribosylglycinamide formyltransferase [Nitrosomonas sp. Is37]|uniref:formate-dependent phosphoribosylglycinamide formyltransferase n=1 Tax=Nitrosomonas sp. Is37 TaxID=3080535 RepID=UPI00294B660A|nr:formate-dependent phosphoribosylglycinamide formyltransferase [Nitrosomonas sp. Is37]MDV6345819.1 formate-dependent phosphoribosylglycinamide formyltransferase [Nitrosomonas sp. Is37]